MDFDVGGKIRALRKARSFSQRDLAARSTLTNGAISMIEKNQTSPSVATLKKILDGLDVTMSEFFALGEAEGMTIFHRAESLRELNPEAMRGAGQPAVSLRQVGDGSSLQVLYERYPPGADTGEDMISHDAEEGGIVIAGTIEITVSGQREVLGPGDAYLFDSRLPHRFRNAGDAECVIVSACTPPSF